MKKIIFFITFALFSFFISNAVESGFGSLSGINSKDCDVAARSLATLLEDIKDKTLSKTQENEAAVLLKENISAYEGDPEKCVLVSPDFVRVLSIDALAEYNDKRNKFIFVDLLRYSSRHQAGDVRQHAALALSRIEAYDTFAQILQAARDEQTYRIGYRGDMELNERPTIERLIKSEKRDITQDDFNFLITRAMERLARKKDYDALRLAIIEELNFQSEGKSRWNDLIRADMLRIASKVNPQDAMKLIEMHKSLSALQKLRAYAYIRDNRIIAPLTAIINESARTDSRDVPEEMKLAIYMIRNLSTKEAQEALKGLASSSDQTVSFMGNVFLTMDKNESAFSDIKLKLPLVPDRLKIEGLKALAEYGDRNSIPIIKGIYESGSLRIKTYSIWSLSKLKVTDLMADTLKLIAQIKPQDERGAKLDMISSLKESVKLMQETKPAY